MTISKNLYLNKNNYNLLILISSIILIVIRHIDFFIYPRFWAEEASVYFQDAYLNGLSSLLHGHQGYYSIVPNFSTFFATLVPLEYAPNVTIYISFLIQTIPFYLIYKSSSKFLNTTLKKLVSSLIILFVVSTPEVWLNTITSQFHFVIILFLILMDEQIKSKKYLYYTLTFIAGLSGVPSNILAPSFILRFFQTKNKHYLYLFTILGFTCVIQIFFILSSDGPPRILNNYSIHEMLNHILKIYIYTIQYPIAYSDSVLYTIFTLPLVYMLYKVFHEYGDKKEYCLFFCSSFLLSIIMLLTSLNMTGGGRYAYAPSIIFTLGLYAIYSNLSISSILRKIALIYMSIAILVGLSGYFFIGFYGTDRNQLWKEEVLLYRGHSTDILAIYPDSWTVTLPRKVKD